MAEFAVRDLSPALGAEVEGVDLSSELDGDTIQRLRQLFDDRSVLVFRDVELDDDDQAYLAGLLVGREAPRDRGSAIDNAVVYKEHYSNKEEGGYAPTGRLLYHSDSMWAETPSELLSLYGVKVGQPSVPTTWVSTAYAWTSLPDQLRKRIEGLEVEHMTGQQPRGNEAEMLKAVHEETRSVVTPIAKPHPRTGRPLLFASEMATSRILGMTREDSEDLLQELFTHLYNDPENFYQHEWRQHDLVIWDNVATQHGRPNLTREGAERTLRKVIAPVPTHHMAKPSFVDTAASS
ncbi:MAG TPA: TauD/TfdA family dioxygenase [Acidimicrobiales bacterium]